MGIFNFHKNTFKHGLHPPEHKGETNGLPIRQFSFAPMMILPVAQHLGSPSEIVVREGQEVVRGQLIAKATGYVSVPLHAPVSGTVRKIANVPTISGKMVSGIYLQTFPYSGQEVLEGTPIDVETATKEEILKGIQDAGIVGLGGAAFPTHVKLKVPEGKTCEVLIINGIECEPYLTTDHRVMLEQADDIFMGIKYLLKVTGAKRVIIGIEANKQDAADHLEKKLPTDLPISVKVVPVKYPQGAEKMLITAILGREVPSGGLPIEVNAVVVNVATTAEIGRLLPHGRGIQERVITITGPGVKKKGNYLIPVGTPLRYVLEQVGAAENISEVYMGGPMMGVAVSNLDISIVKGTSGIVVFTENEIKKQEKVYPCIKCGACVDACPISLNPSKLGILAKFEAYDQMAEDYHLMDCFECGSCSYVCPSHIPLVQYFRLSKSIVRKRKATKQPA
ncbi:MAG: electron transport complex subunit RsxC [Saprospiraceae bacterium]|nr:electron transport complex subunit RsxC [Saprospiraceae bacterium]MCF8250242.1 electron transport complex subunit RsxC [Saprospiraceae bacterium]MCF8279995.1 electron transport complex subunit RsxC [Bacteroidales bacterium]MCF8312050.1 electron transport complex subunit RsxC [Saprospiraceae bacterium]MCF8441147.1 electron transport complex subunit RsxC [Saprospiraceae bacterium]